MSKFLNVVEIDRPIDKVFEFVSDLAKRQEWDAELVETRRTSDGDLGMGSTSIDVYSMHGQRMEFETVITSWDPPRAMAWSAVSGSMKAEGHWTFEETDRGTRVNLAMEISTSNTAFKLLASLFADQIKKQIEKNGRRMKEAAEADIPT